MDVNLWPFGQIKQPCYHFYIAFILKILLRNKLNQEVPTNDLADHMARNVELGDVYQLLVKEFFCHSMNQGCSLNMALSGTQLLD